MNAKTIISSICILLAICLAFYFYAEWQKARFVAKAWAKVDYLAENPFAWGGNADPKTEALIQQLSEPEYDEGQSEESLQLEMGQRLDELISLRDPRAIETVVAYQCWGEGVYAHVGDFFINMGPPVIPYLLPYLEENRGAADASGFLAIIGKEHREELDGIVEYIILPKLEQILATTSSPLVRKRVEEAIDWLKQ